MGRIVAIGEAHRMRGFALVGCDIVTVPDTEAARQAWSALDDEVELVLLTQTVASALADELEVSGAPLVAVMPS